MEIAKIVAQLITALVELVNDAIEAYLAGDPSKLKKVTDLLPQGKQLKSEQQLALERERMKQALNG